MRFWEDRVENGERARQAGDAHPSTRERPANSHSLAMRIVGGAHPVDDVRVLRLKRELERWETERVAARAKAQSAAAV